jgi:BirA family transcriptional regulator, biotin operon repressor / biotin---[acetyl-CoA-carboxylase] ligase
VQHNSGIRKSAPTRRHQPTTSPLTDARLGQIVRLLTDHATVVVSGTKIAAELGTARSEVWRLIRQLRTMGVAIAGHPATGYQLQAVPDLLLPQIVNPLVQGTIFAGKLHHFYKIGSTNSAAMEAAAEDAPEGSVFLAEEQTAGRGRSANDWHSARCAGIYCSVILRPSLPPSEVLPFSLAAGLAVRSAVLEVGGLTPDLKWPNDLLIGDRKFCGILAEMNAEATRIRHIVVGIGINVNHTTFPEPLRSIATSLRIATGTEWSRVELVAALLKSLDREYRALQAGDGARESILHRFEEYSSWASGRAVRIDEGPGFEGTTEGLDANGFLRVRTANGLKTVVSGTIRAR